MTKMIVIAFALLVLSRVLPAHPAAAAPADDKAPTRAACIGDSITFGAGTESPRTDSYPARLARMLGPSYSVMNFGVSGTTMLKEGDHPYWKTGQMKKALQSKPDVVVIMLGTNDTKPQNWKFKDRYPPDYTSMIDQFKTLDSHPKIFICLPPVVPKTGNFGINEEGVEEEIPMLRKLAGEEHVTVIDNYTPLKGKDDLLPDNVHPNNEGAGLLAKSVYEGITGKKFEGEVPAASTQPTK